MSIMFLILMIALLSFSFNNVRSSEVKRDVNAKIDQILPPDQESVQGILPLPDPTINANVTDSERNITITKSAKVVLEDTMVIKLIGNSSLIHTFNYSLPAEVGNHFVKARFWFSFNETLPNRNSTYQREYTVIYGLRYTMFEVPILPPQEIGGVYLNNKTSLHVVAEIQFENLMTFYTEGLVQKARFNMSIIPFLPNIRVGNHSAITFIKSDDTVDFEGMTKDRPDAVNNWIYHYQPQSVIFGNLTREPFDINQPMQVNDTNPIIIQSADSPNAKQVATIPFEFTNITRDISITTWGQIHVKEQITIKHLGAPRVANASTFNVMPYALTKVSLGLPLNSTALNAYDEVGLLNSGNRDPETGELNSLETVSRGLRTIEVVLRIPIYGGENYSFTVEYDLTAESYLYKNGSKYVFSIPLMDVQNTTVNYFSMNIHLPTGSAFQSTNMTTRTQNALLTYSFSKARSPLSLFSHPVINVVGYNLTDIDNLIVGFEYDFSGIYYFAPVINLFVYTLILALGYYFIRSVKVQPKEQVTVAKEKIPVEEIHKFLEDYGEKDGIRRRLRALADSYRARKIKAKEFKEKTKVLESRMRQVIKRLEISSRNLKQKGTFYEDTVNKILVNDQKLNDTIDLQKKLMANYRKGQITKDAYMRTMRDYEKDIKKAQGEINKRLNDLKQLLERD